MPAGLLKAAPPVRRRHRWRLSTLQCKVDRALSTLGSMVGVEGIEPSGRLARRIYSPSRLHTGLHPRYERFAGKDPIRNRKEKEILSVKSRDFSVRNRRYFLQDAGKQKPPEPAWRRGFRSTLARFRAIDVLHVWPPGVCEIIPIAEGGEVVRHSEEIVASPFGFVKLLFLEITRTTPRHPRRWGLGFDGR